MMLHISGEPAPIRKRGFTLVELLVVVAIIALLVSILLPALGRAKAVARMVVCQTNLYAIGQGAHMYSGENDDYIPRGMALPNNDPNSGNFGYYMFPGRLSPYVGGPVVPFFVQGESEGDNDFDDRIYGILYDTFKNIDAYRCPSFQDPEYVLTYMVNARRMEKSPTSTDPETGASKLADLPVATADVFYIGELNPVELDATGHFGIYDIFMDYHVTYDRNGMENPAIRTIRSDDERHAGRTTMIFFDGHSESRWITPEEMPLELFYPDF